MPRLGIVNVHDIVKSWLFWILVITGIAIVLRSLPAWTNAAWGCDFGIYYGLTNSFVENGALFSPYYGWGASYQYFPVLYAITGGLHWITGLDVLTIMPKLVPIFGGLSVLFFYFIVYELIGDRKIALFSSLFLAVLPFHVYQTSHASPLTIGHFFMMFSLYLFIKYRQDVRYIVPLMIATVLLVMSHHLTTYFYLISLIFIVFVENASRKEWTPHVMTDGVYILGMSGLVFSYWALVATPVYTGFMSNGIRFGSMYLDSIFVIPLFYMGFFSLFGIIWLKRRYNIFSHKEQPTTQKCLVKFFATLLICLTAMSVFTVVKLPWTNFSFTLLSILYSLPLLIVFSFGVAGFRYLRFIRNGAFVKGWLLAILLSFLYALLSNSRSLFPHRHLEYMMAPLSIITIYGIRAIFLQGNYQIFSQWKEKYLHISKASFHFSDRRRLVHKRQLVYLMIVVLLATTNAVSVYPSHVALNASYEAITNEDLSVLDWMEMNLDKNTSVIASDHRLARMIEAVGFNTSIDEASVIWSEENPAECVDELYGIGKNYSIITHVVIDDIMRERVVHVGFGNIVYMTDASYEKFSYPPFELVYRNATLNQAMEEEHWAEVYAVNWAFLE
jgi:hypothetical protein